MPHISYWEKEWNTGPIHGQVNLASLKDNPYNGWSWTVFPMYLIQIALSSASELHVFLFQLFVLEQTYLLWLMKGEIPLCSCSVPFCPSVNWHVPHPRNQNDWSSQEHGQLFWASTSETTCKICYGKSPTPGCKNHLPFNMLSYGSSLHQLQTFSLLKELDLGCPCRDAAHGEKVFTALLGKL